MCQYNMIVYFMEHPVTPSVTPSRLSFADFAAQMPRSVVVMSPTKMIKNWVLTINNPDCSYRVHKGNSVQLY